MPQKCDKVGKKKRVYNLWDNVIEKCGKPQLRYKPNTCLTNCGT